MGGDGQEDLENLLGRAKSRGKQQNQQTSVSLFQSEYNRIIMLCYQFSQAFIEVGSATNRFERMRVEARRNRLFQTIAMLAEQRDELPTVKEYFGNRKYGKFRMSIAEMQALEYVSKIQDLVMELSTPGVEPQPIDQEETIDSDDELSKEMFG